LRDEILAIERERIPEMSARDYDVLNKECVEMLQHDISELQDESDLFLAELLNARDCEPEPFKRFLALFNIVTSKDVPLRLRTASRTFSARWEDIADGKHFEGGVAHKETSANEQRDFASFYIAEWLSKGGKNGDVHLSIASTKLAALNSPEKVNFRDVMRRIVELSKSDEAQDLMTPYRRENSTKERSGARAVADFIVAKIAGKEPPRTGIGRKSRKSKGKSSSAQ
jgi:hypothetical protein